MMAWRKASSWVMSRFGRVWSIKEFFASPRSRIVSKESGLSIHQGRESNSNQPCAPCVSTRGVLQLDVFRGPGLALVQLHQGGVAPPERLASHASQGRLFQPRCQALAGSRN